MTLPSATLNHVAVGKPIYALCRINGKTRRLRATHYAMVVSGGVDALWGVWTMGGTFRRYHLKRKAVEEAYPDLVWRRMSARLSLTSPVVDQPSAKERDAIRAHYDRIKARRPPERQDTVVPLKA